MLSVIVPAYNEEAMIKKAASVISGILADANIPCELMKPAEKLSMKALLSRWLDWAF